MAIIHQALGEQALAAFEHIESRPIASASIAQVHAARLITGEGVVIKVVRPCVEGQIRREMGALIELAAWLAQRLPILRQLHLPQIMRDQLAVMLAELSMFLEARIKSSCGATSRIHHCSSFPGFTHSSLGRTCW